MGVFGTSGFFGDDAEHDRQRVRELIELVPTPLTAFPPNGLGNLANGAYRDLFGLTEQDVKDRVLFDVVHPEDIEAAVETLASIGESERVGPLDIRIRHAQGHWVRCSFTARRDPETQWILVSANDVTTRQERTNKLETEARTDHLTGIANRGGLLEALRERPELRHNCLVALIDLDGFKLINDRFGHSTGDEVLRVIAQRLSSAAPPSSIVSRMGGDEFVVVLPDNARPSTVAEFGDALRRILDEPIRLGGRQVEVSASIGIAESMGRSDPATLLERADVATYAAKKIPGSAWILAADGLMSARRDQMLAEQRLRSAVGTGVFVPWFQPIVDARTGNVIGHEVLARWMVASSVLAGAFAGGRTTPAETAMAAASFLDLAQIAGVIDQVSLEVITAAMAESMPSGQRVHLNLSASELVDGAHRNRVHEILDLAGVEPSTVVIEVQERAIDGDVARNALDRLRALGFGIALDDFGHGPSSASMLFDMPFDQVKIDLAHLRRRHEQRSADVFRALSELVRNAGMTLAIEGISTTADLDLARSVSPDLLQGNHLAVPAAQTVDGLRLGPDRVVDDSWSR